MDYKNLVNWIGLSEILSGEKRAIRAGRKNKKYSKQIESLEKHLLAWAKENDITIK